MTQAEPADGDPAVADPADGLPGPRWQRPVPLVGDPTSAAHRAADPAGWAFSGEVRTALGEVIAARRDIRRFRPDAVPEDVLTAVLEAGHRAPSVGHSQPWRFIVVTASQTRDRAAVMADRERLAQAAALDPERARRLLDLQLEGIREAPVGIVVACDRRAAAGGVLGRATFPDADLWSCACAIENMWLTARAHGLGLGWVTLFRPEELAALLGLPDGVVTLGWLCLGWPDERPPEPGLQRHAWSHRLPLAEVVLRERWPGAAAPAAPPSYLRAPAPDRRVAATDDADGLLTPPGSLGLLDAAVHRLVALGARDVRSGTLVLAGADHPVAGLGVTAFPPGVTREVITAAVAGEALGAVSAVAAGLTVTVVDAGVTGGPVPGARAARPEGLRGDLVETDALTRADAQALLDAGRVLGREAAGAGLVVLGEVGLGNTTVAAALAGALLGLDPDEVVGLGAGSDTAMVERKREVVGLALHRWRASSAAGSAPAAAPGSGAGAASDPLVVLAALGGPELAVLAGVVLGAAEAGAGVVLDGLATGVAALVAARLEPAVSAYLVAGHLSREQAHRRVLTELGLEPLLDLRLRAGEGVGGCLAAGLLLQALAVRRRAGRTLPV
ncbi:MAG TPA: 5,6-dimethylbenzimidazole synthase [Kineosporiaceae bacterium]|nr:5,6-dimethylbenzimidazole synthase [Kineosporiaceae bacterium]